MYSNRPDDTAPGVGVGSGVAVGSGVGVGSGMGVGVGVGSGIAVGSGVGVGSGAGVAHAIIVIAAISAMDSMSLGIEWAFFRELRIQYRRLPLMISYGCLANWVLPMTLRGERIDTIT